MFLFIHGLTFTQISFFESFMIRACSSKSAFTLAKHKSKAKLTQISFEDKVLSQGISLSHFQIHHD